MKKIILLFALMTVLFSLEGNGQTLTCSNAYPVTTIKVETYLQSGDRITQVVHDVVVTRTGNGEIIHKVNVETIMFNGSAALVNETSTVALFDALSASTVRQAAMAGFPACPASCTAPAMVRVEIPACVTRGGSGLGTRFVSCGIQECSWRMYTLCCPNGGTQPSVSFIDRSRATQCGATCENSCQ